MLDDWADRGRAGTVLMRELLEARPVGYVPPASNLEARFATPRRAPLRRPLPSSGRPRRRDVDRPVDFLHARCPLVVEVLSELFHAALVDQAADARRFELLEGDRVRRRAGVGPRSCRVTPVPRWRAVSRAEDAPQCDSAA